MVRGELGIPLFVVRLDSLITKFMGETAAKLRQVFDAVASTRGVYLFDEFDAIGSQRGMANDVGEIRRILNSFLLMIEQDESSSIIVAATNHPDILDEALFRRFDDVVQYHVPSADEVKALLRMRLANYLKSPKALADLAEVATGLSHAEVARAVWLKSARPQPKASSFRQPRFNKSSPAFTCPLSWRTSSDLGAACYLR